jgi:hypothetical protein
MATLAMGQSLKKATPQLGDTGPLSQGHNSTRPPAQALGPVEALAERQAVFFLAATFFFTFTLRAPGCLAEVSVIW